LFDIAAICAHCGISAERSATFRLLARRKWPILNSGLSISKKWRAARGETAAAVAKSSGGSYLAGESLEGRCHRVCIGASTEAARINRIAAPIT